MNGARGIVIAVVASLIVGFSAGLVCGIVFMRFGPPDMPFGMRGGPHAGHMPGFGPMGLGPGAAPGPGPLMARMDRDLELTPEQHTRILAVLEGMRSRHLALRDSTHAAIEQVLTESQRQRWRALEDRYRRSWHGRAGRPGSEVGRPPGEGPIPEERP